VIGSVSEDLAQRKIVVIVVKRQMGILFSGISWREHATFIDMMMPTVYTANTLGWIFIVLTH
jgi:hypothetical protein